MKREQPVIFLDRDGVINRYPGNFNYVSSVKAFQFLPRAKKALAALTKFGFRVIVISNQAGVSKEIYSQKVLDEITKKMITIARASGGIIDKAYYCTHTSEQRCDCRKPKIGLLKKTKKEFGPFDFKKTFFIGDSIRDVQTGKAAGCKTILVLCGREKLTNKKNWEFQPDFIARDLFEATRFVLAQQKAGRRS